jgi:hypothetical protein
MIDARASTSRAASSGAGKGCRTRAEPSDTGRPEAGGAHDDQGKLPLWWEIDDDLPKYEEYADE